MEGICSNTKMSPPSFGCSCFLFSISRDKNNIRKVILALKKQVCLTGQAPCICVHECLRRATWLHNCKQKNKQLVSFHRIPLKLLGGEKKKKKWDYRTKWLWDKRGRIHLRRKQFMFELHCNSREQQASVFHIFLSQYLNGNLLTSVYRHMVITAPSYEVKT